MLEKQNYNNLLDKIVRILTEARTKVVRNIDTTQVLAYWQIGFEIVEYEQKGKSRAEYGEYLIQRLSKDMTQKFGKGFSERNIEQMRKLYLTYQQKPQTLSAEFRKYETVSHKFEKSQTLSGKSRIRQTMYAKFEPQLSWSKYCELLKVDEPLSRHFYEIEANKNDWSVRVLKRQINSINYY
jgi:hypothetical protein